MRNLIRFIGYPIGIFIVMSIVVSIMMMLGMDVENVTTWIITTVISVVLLWYLSGLAKIKNLNDALVVGITWAAIFFVLDWFVTKSFAPDYFNDPKVWLVYAFPIVITVVRSSLKK